MKFSDYHFGAPIVVQAIIDAMEQVRALVEMAKREGMK